MHLITWMAIGGLLSLTAGQAQAQHEMESDDQPQEALATDSLADASPVEVAKGFLYKTVEFGGESYAYCVYVPPEYTEERAWPTILFLHGSGERGNDGFLQTEVGIGRAIRRNHKLCPAIVVMPQCRAGKFWEGDMLTMALACVEDASQDYHCDPDRVCLTGLSMGGAGAWLLGSRMPQAFAAVVPICGFYGPLEASVSREELAKAAANLAGLPIWCFHGALDPAVPVARTREMVTAVQAAGGTIRYDEIPEGKHNVWDVAYRNPALWQWLLAQRRAAPAEENP